MNENSKYTKHQNCEIHEKKKEEHALTVEISLVETASNMESVGLASIVKMSEVGVLAFETVAMMSYASNDNIERMYTHVSPGPLMVSRSFKEGESLLQRVSVRPNLNADEFRNLLHGSNPIKVELNRLDNKAKDDDCELEEA